LSIPTSTNMPNIGVPSKACHLCRKRRVKVGAIETLGKAKACAENLQCDFTQPGCFRCAKLDVACTGYRDEQDLLFRNQNEISYSRKKKSRTPSKRKSPSNRGSPSSTSSLAALERSDDSTKLLYTKPVDTSAIRYIADSLPLQISYDWELCSVSIVLHQFSAPVCDSGNSRYFGYLDFLPDLYSESANSSCLSLATNAVAKTYISNTRNIMLSGNDQIRTYSQALKALQRALDDLSERSKDSKIICVWLLSMFEVNNVCILPVLRLIRTCRSCNTFQVSFRARNLLLKHGRDIRTDWYHFFVQEAQANSQPQEVVISSR
jgi:hypothetical protein